MATKFVRSIEEQVEQQLKIHLDCRNFYQNYVFEK